jgi:hypothetical protein
LTESGFKKTPGDSNMKKNLMIALVAVSAVFATAALADDAGEWTCFASGELGVGGPVGQVWQNVMGHGSTQMEAIDNAMNQCTAGGLEMCTLGSCSQDGN